MRESLDPLFVSSQCEAETISKANRVVELPNDTLLSVLTCVLEFRVENEMDFDAISKRRAEQTLTCKPGR